MIGSGNLGSYKQARKIITHVSNSPIRIEITVSLNVLHRGLIQMILKNKEYPGGCAGAGYPDGCAATLEIFWGVCRYVC